MTDEEKNPIRIRIEKNGPYTVFGNIPLGEKILVFRGSLGHYREGRRLDPSGMYTLCRCGHSSHAPFCDGSHHAAHFRGIETASRDPYTERAEKLTGESVDLLDDNRCAYARLCHGKNGNTWDLTRRSGVKENHEEAIRTASDCPAGRLTAVEKNGDPIEPLYEKAIDILQDPDEGVSAGIFVRGGIELESADGTLYETRNRYTLCRCGKSRHKPFCDASHIPEQYIDGIDSSEEPLEN